MGFDVIYFPPIHPIGVTNRKGKNNTLTTVPGDVGSPWAIGSATGGHRHVEPSLGTIDDFIWLISEADERGLGVSSASVYPGASENELCVQTDVRYFLWTGRADPVGYCECYTRSAENQPWVFTDSVEPTCPAIVEAQP